MLSVQFCLQERREERGDEIETEEVKKWIRCTIVIVPSLPSLPLSSLYSFSFSLSLSHPLPLCPFSSPLARTGVSFLTAMYKATLWGAPPTSGASNVLFKSLKNVVHRCELTCKCCEYGCDVLVIMWSSWAVCFCVPLQELVIICGTVCAWVSEVRYACTNYGIHIHFLCCKQNLGPHHSRNA